LSGENATRKTRAEFQAGITLVEVMASGVILGISVTGSYTMLRAAQEMEFRKNVERQAYQLAYSILEYPYFDYWPNYNTMKVDSSETEHRFNVEGRDINASVSVDVHPEGVDLWPSFTAARRVDATVRWSLDGAPDSVRVTKVLGEAR
jgi:hypothetical protein